jgi:O-antigen ligase
MTSLKTLFTQKHFLWIVYAFSAGVVLLQVLGVIGYPAWTIAVLLVILGYILFSSNLYGVYLTTALLPWYTVMHTAHLGSISMWRIVVIVLFLKIFFSHLSKPTTNLKTIILHAFKEASDFLNSFDFALIILLLFCGLSILWAGFKVPAIKEIIFILNAYLYYLCVKMVINTESNAKQLLKYAAYSVGVIVLIGFIQWLLNFFMDFWFFWQYWAVRVSSVYYGDQLAGVLQYSNSWFSVDGGGRSLRMFSILPDSHSFALIAVYGMAFLLPFTAEPKTINEFGKKVFNKARLAIWYIIRFFGLAVVLSGTRGVWVGMLLPLVLLCGLYFKKIARPLTKKLLIPIIFIILFFPLTIVFDAAFRYIHSSASESSFSRALSIVNKNEESNKGRLEMWSNSIKYAVSHPVGTGLNNFIVAVTSVNHKEVKYKSIAEEVNQTYNLPQKYITAHNLFLQVWVELGWLGVILFVYLSWQVVKLFGLYFWKVKDQLNFSSLTVSAWFVVMLWLVGYAVFDVTLLNDRVLLYTFLGLAVSFRLMDLLPEGKHE